LIVPGPDPDEPTTVVPLARSTDVSYAVRLSGPSKVTPLSVPPRSEKARVPAVESIVPPEIVPPSRVSVPPVWLKVPLRSTSTTAQST